MTDEQNDFEHQRELLVRSLTEAYEEIHLLPGVDENGPALVWLAEHLLQLHHRAEQPA